MIQEAKREHFRNSAAASQGDRANRREDDGGKDGALKEYLLSDLKQREEHININLTSVGQTWAWLKDRRQEY